jgi:hypothetical protein
MSLATQKCNRCDLYQCGFPWLLKSLGDASCYTVDSDISHTQQRVIDLRSRSLQANYPYIIDVSIIIHGELYKQPKPISLHLRKTMTPSFKANL